MQARQTRTPLIPASVGSEPLSLCLGSRNGTYCSSCSPYPLVAGRDQGLQSSDAVTRSLRHTNDRQTVSWVAGQRERGSKKVDERRSDDGRILFEAGENRSSE